MVDVKRKKNESFEAMARRFTKRIQQSGKVIQAKRVQLLEKKLNKNLRKNLKLRRLELNAQKERMRKSGRLKEEE